MKKAIVIILTLAVAGVATFFIYNQHAKKESEKANLESQNLEQDQVSKSVVAGGEQSAEDFRKASELLKVTKVDFVLGNADAPVTMIEYASLSCPHCAAFNREAFERLKGEYIDSGKVKFIYRDFPLNHPALMASLFATCQAEDNPSDAAERYYSTIKALFKTQDSWAFDKKYGDKLKSIAQLDGMSVKRFDSCINNQAAQHKILANRMEAAKVLKMQSTPVFFVNGEISEGYVDYVTLKKVIDKKIAEAEMKGAKSNK